MIYPLVKTMQEQLKESVLTIEDIDQVIGMTKSIFGVDWLEDLASERKEQSPTSQHPILVGSSSGSFMALIELVELCTYLMSFKDDKNLLKNIIPTLKNASSYGDSLFQLATAYRFKKLGFSVELEPPILNGCLADFRAIKGDLDIFGECTVLREWGIRTHEREAFFEASKKIKQFHQKTEEEIVIDIVLKTTLSFENLEEIKKQITSLGRSFLKTKTKQIASTDAYEISVTELDDKIRKFLTKQRGNLPREKEWDQIIAFSLAEPKVPGDVTTVDLNAPLKQTVIRYKTLLRPEKEFSYSLEDRLDKKVGEKARQLKSHPKGSSSLLFVNVEDNLKDMDGDRIMHRINKNVFSKIGTLNGVFISKREWEKLRYNHQGTFINNGANSLNEHLFDAFNTNERDIDFVKEWRTVFNAH